MSDMKQFEHLKIPLKAIKAATKNFSNKCLVGEGGFGKAYKGEIVHSGGKTVAAIKRLSGMGDTQFLKEIMEASQNKTRFRFLGYCDDCGEKILVFEHAPIKNTSHMKQFENLKISLEVIKAATNDFSDECLVEEEELGEVYKGEIVHSKGKTVVAMKRLSGLGDPQFFKEILKASQDKNGFRFLGYCDDGGEKILVFEYGPTFSNREDAPIKNKPDMKQFEHLKIPLKAIKAATKNFSNKCLVGEGGFGKAYKGEIVHSGGKTVAAIKRLSGMGDTQFLKEIMEASQNKTRFRFLGYCDDCGEKILVFEHAPIKNMSHMKQFENLKISLEVIKAATNDFSDECLVEEEELGEVYKGEMVHSKGKTVIAMKRLSGLGDPQFFEEILKASQDKNGFRFLGYCDDGGEKILVFEYGPTFSNRKDAPIKNMSDMKQFEHLKIPLEAIKAATNNFSDECLVGKGGFGKAYKGEIVHSGGKTVAAIKRFSGLGDTQFLEEIMEASQNKTRIRFLGYCDDCGEKIEVFKYATPIYPRLGDDVTRDGARIFLTRGQI